MGAAGLLPTAAFAGVPVPSCPLFGGFGGAGAAPADMALGELVCLLYGLAGSAPAQPCRTAGVAQLLMRGLRRDSVRAMHTGLSHVYKIVLVAVDFKVGVCSAYIAGYYATNGTWLCSVGPFRDTPMLVRKHRPQRQPH
jgi:hypothetical protein